MTAHKEGVKTHIHTMKKHMHTHIACVKQFIMAYESQAFQVMSCGVKQAGLAANLRVMLDVDLCLGHACLCEHCVCLKACISLQVVVSF